MDRNVVATDARNKDRLVMRLGWATAVQKSKAVRIAGKPTIWLMSKWDMNYAHRLTPLISCPPEVERGRRSF